MIHCMQVFDDAGYRFTAYHSNKSGADRIYVDIALYNPPGLNWVNLSPTGGVLNMPSGYTQANFPVIAEDQDDKIIVASSSSNNNQAVLHWRCDGVQSACNTTSEWGTGVATDLPGKIYNPQVAIETGHAFLLYENESHDRIGVAKWCSGDTGWTVAGEAMRLMGYSEYRFSAAAGSSTPVFTVDDDNLELRAVFLGKIDSRWNPIHWEMDILDLCP